MAVYKSVLELWYLGLGLDFLIGLGGVGVGVGVVGVEVVFEKRDEEFG